MLKGATYNLQLVRFVTKNEKETRGFSILEKLPQLNLNENVRKQPEPPSYSGLNQISTYPDNNSSTRELKSC